MKAVTNRLTGAGRAIDSSRTFDVLGVPISVTSVDDTIEKLIHWARDDTGRFVCVRDTPSVVLSLDDPDMRAAHEAAAMITPDGTPLMLIGRMHGLPVKRTTGTDLMNTTMDRGRAAGLRHFLYGGEPGIAEALQTRLKAAYPGVEIVGTICPPFRKATAEEDAATRAAIARSGAHLVWVGISTPKQEYWMLENHHQLPVTMLGVGAAFDFLSGAKQRAPAWMRDHGLEWLHRLVSEPRRLWRRYLVLAPTFVVRYAWQAIRGK